MKDGERSPLALLAVPERFLLVVFGPTHRGKLLWSSHSSETCRVVETSSPKKKRKGYKWQCEVRSVRVVVVATDLPQIASRVE